jgi:hypothetical protein
VGYLEGLLGGFTGRKREYEAEQMDMAAKRSDREARVYEALLSSPDPEIQSLAAAGLLESARGPMKKGGIAGWLGQMEESAILPQIQRLVQTPVMGTKEVPGTPTLPSKSMTGYLATPPPITGSLAQSTGSPTEGEPTAPLQVDETVTADVDRTPPSALTITEQPSRPTTVKQPTLVPRRVFLSPEESMLRNKRAAAQGDVEGEVAGLIAAGYTEQEARALVAKKYERRYGAGGADRSIFGEILQPDGTWKSGSVVFDPQSGAHIDISTGQPVAGFRRNTTTGSTSLGADREAIARADYGKSYAELTQEQQQAVLAKEIQRAGSKAGAVTTGRGEAAAGVPLSTAQRYQATSDLSKQWTSASEAFRTMQQQFALMQTGLSRYDQDPIGASQAVLVTFQKVLDPTSVVRESEYARSPQGLSLLDWLQGKYEQYRAGGVGVPKPILEQMVKTAEAFLSSENLKSSLDNVRQRIYDTSVGYEIDPSMVLGPDAARVAPRGAIGQPPPGGPQGAPPAAGPPPVTPGKTSPGTDWQMINGQLHYKGKPY